MVNKTQPTSKSPTEYISSLKNPTRERYAFELLKIYEEITCEPPTMWGPSIIGFGQYHYHYASGRKGDFLKGGFAPRQANMVVYIMSGAERYAKSLAELGPHKTGKSCLYLGSFDKINLAALKAAISEDWQWMTKKYG